MRAVSWAALAASVTLATFTASAGPGPLSSISGDAILGTVGAVLFALIAGYTKRMDRDLSELKGATERTLNAVFTEQKQQQAQINLLRAEIRKEHPSRDEFTDMRDDMRLRFNRLEMLLRNGHKGREE
jgi:hypothetical protein